MLASTLDEYSRLFCSPFSPFPILDCCDQTLEPRSQTPPSTTTTREVPTTTCSPLTTIRSSLGGSQAGGMHLVWSVSQFVLAFLRQTCLTYVCTQILLLALTRLWSSTCIRALEAPGLYYDACMNYLCFRVVLWYLPVSPWSWSYTFACMFSVRLNRGRHKLVSEPTACRNSPFQLLGRSWV